MARTLTPERQALALEAKNLREFGYTQQEIADALSVHQQTVSNWLKIVGNGTSSKVGKQNNLPTIPLVSLPTIDVTLYPCRYEDAGGSIPAGSIDLILTDPLAFTEAIKSIAGGKGEDSAVKETMAAMQKTIEELKEDRWQMQFDVQQKQLQDLAGVLNKSLEAIADMKKERVGRTEMDILHDIATEGIGLAKTELPGLRRDIKEMVGSVALPPAKTLEQREDRKKKFKQALDTDREIEELGQRLFFSES